MAGLDALGHFLLLPFLLCPGGSMLGWEVFSWEEGGKMLGMETWGGGGAS